MTEVAAAAMTRDQAERLTERARLVATTLMEARDKLAGILQEANEGRVWEALDMPNIQAWTEFAFSTTPLAQLSREDRRVIVKELAAEGYGTRAIAPIVGKSHMSVARDLASVTDVTDEAPAPREVHGRDGITRTFQTRPALEPVTVDHDTGEITQTVPRKRPRRPIHETARTAAMNLREAADRLGIEVHDDRFPAIAEELAPQLRNQLAYVIETCQGYLDELTPNKE